MKRWDFLIAFAVGILILLLQPVWEDVYPSAKQLIIERGSNLYSSLAKVAVEREFQFSVFALMAGAYLMYCTFTKFNPERYSRISGTDFLIYMNVSIFGSAYVFSIGCQLMLGNSSLNIPLIVAFPFGFASVVVAFLAIRKFAAIIRGREVVS